MAETTGFDTATSDVNYVPTVDSYVAGFDSNRSRDHTSPDRVRISRKSCG